MNILTKEQLYKAAPSLFTQGAAEHTSERYQPIATYDIINVLLQEGFYPTKATQSASRHQERKAFANTWSDFDIKIIKSRMEVYFLNWSWSTLTMACLRIG